MLIFKSKSVIFRVDNKKLSDDVIMMIEVEFGELGTLSEETIKKYEIKIEST